MGAVDSCDNWEYDCWGIPPDSVDGELVFCSTFSQSRWQWAEKLAKTLEDKGYTGVRVIPSRLKEDSPHG